MTKPSNRVTALFIWIGISLFLLPEPLQALASDEVAISPDVTVVPAEIISKTQVPPIFPLAAKAARFSGSVTVEVLIDIHGLVARANVVKSTHAKVGFEEAALVAVRRWRFLPALLNGDPVPFETEFELTFDRRGTGILTAASLDSGHSAGSRHAVRWQPLDPNRNSSAQPGNSGRRPRVAGGATGVPSRR